MGKLKEHKIVYKPSDSEIAEKVALLNRKKTRFDDKLLTDKEDDVDGHTSEFFLFWKDMVGEPFSIQDYKDYILPYITENSFIDVIYPYDVDDYISAMDCVKEGKVYWVFEPNVSLDFGDGNMIQDVYLKFQFTKDRVFIESIHEKKYKHYSRDTSLMIESKKKIKESKKNKNIWYHVGDFSHKAEPLCKMFNRGTGFFGTGHYFCSEWEYCVRQGGGHRPLYAIDISRYNLKYGDLSLHDALKKFHRYMCSYQLLKESIDEELWWHIQNYYNHLTWDGKYTLVDALIPDYEYYKERYPQDNFKDYIEFNSDLRFFLEYIKQVDDLQNLAKLLECEAPPFEKIKKYQTSVYFDKETYNLINELHRSEKFLQYDLGVSEKKFHDICEDIYSDLEQYYDDGYLDENKIPSSWDIDSIPTRFIKALGYDGILATRECDNIGYGTCIYDIDMNDVTFVCDDVSEFDGDTSFIEDK